VLAERARALASSDTAHEAAVGDTTLTFILGGARYALPAASVREVLPLGICTPLPAVPPFIVGLVNVRGRLVAALDIRPLLAVPIVPLGPAAMLLIIGPDEAMVGLVADRVVAVEHAVSKLTPTLSSAAGRDTLWLRGVDEQLSLHIDPVALLADPRLLVNQEEALAL
jgi:purine-binding chemotaxis protein CheW